jgi:hypothetical protein
MFFSWLKWGNVKLGHRNEVLASSYHNKSTYYQLMVLTLITWPRYYLPDFSTIKPTFSFPTLLFGSKSLRQLVVKVGRSNRGS